MDYRALLGAGLDGYYMINMARQQEAKEAATQQINSTLGNIETLYVVTAMTKPKPLELENSVVSEVSTADSLATDVVAEGMIASIYALDLKGFVLWLVQPFPPT